MRKKIFALILSLLIVSVGISIFYFEMRPLDRDMVSIKAHYQAYACGDCYPQYQVMEVSVDDKSLQRELLGKEIFVKYPSKTIEKAIDKQTAECAICFTFHFTGQLRKKKDYYVLIAREASALLENKSCCYD